MKCTKYEVCVIFAGLAFCIFSVIAGIFCNFGKGPRAFQIGTSSMLTPKLRKLL